MPNKFSPSLEVLKTARGVIKCVQNPGKNTDAYYPRLTVTQRPTAAGISQTMRIEFSIPKLLLGNNFDELAPYDFDQVAKILQQRLFTMGVMVTKDNLTSAEVSTIHYSKNLLFTDGTTSRMLIGIISKSNCTKRREVNRREYRNEGYAFRWHTNSYEVIYYDKVADLQAAARTEKGRIERDNWMQLTLFDEVPTEKPFEVLRVEIRLNTRTKIRSLLKALSVEKELIFSELFDVKLSKQVILHFWNEMVSALPPRSTRQSKVSSTLRSLASGKGNEGIRNGLSLIALERLIEQEGIPAARALITELTNDRMWYRLYKQLKESSAFTDRAYIAIQKAQKQLNTFHPISVKSLVEM
jgi:hypothetical protein